MNKKSYLRRVRLPRTPADWLEAVMNFIFFLCGMLAVCCVALISVYMVVSGVPAIHKIGLFKFLFGTKWASTAAEPLFGILPFILSSVYGTLGATILGVPIGLLTAVFLSKAAAPKLRTVVVTAIELLSGIPLSLIHISHQSPAVTASPDRGKPLFGKQISYFERRALFKPRGVCYTGLTLKLLPQGAFALCPNNVCFSSPPAAPLPACAPSRG